MIPPTFLASPATRAFTRSNDTSRDEQIALAVVGAGPRGIAAGAAATRAGLEARLYDRGPLTSSLVDYPPYMTFFSSADRLEIGGVPFVVDRGKPGREEALSYYRSVAEHFDLDVRQYEAVTEVIDEGRG